MNKILSSLTPKTILMTAIKDKLQGTGITKIMLVFVLDTGKYNVMLSNAEGKDMKVDITLDEITTLRKIFISRIVKKWNQKYDIKVADVIIEVDVTGENLNIFMRTPEDEVLKFDY